MFYGCFCFAPVLLSWTEVLIGFLPWWSSPGQVWTQQPESFEQRYEHTESTWRRWTWCASRVELLSRDSLTSNDSQHYHYTCFEEAKKWVFSYCVKQIHSLDSLLWSIVNCLLMQTANQSNTLAFSLTDAEATTCWDFTVSIRMGKIEDLSDSECGSWRSECLTNPCWDFPSITTIYLQWIVPKRESVH